MAPPEGKAPPYGWTSKNYVICVCFHCHGTSSYHTVPNTTNSLCTAVNVSASGGLCTLDPLYRPIPHFPPPCYKILAAPLPVHTARLDATRLFCRVADVNRASLAVARATPPQRPTRRFILFTAEMNVQCTLAAAAKQVRVLMKRRGLCWCRTLACRRAN